MERVAHRAEAVRRVDDDRLGEGQLRARREGPREGLGVDPDPETRRSERLDLDLGEEVARVHEGDPDRLAVVLGRRRSAQRHERVVDRRRRAAVARDRLAAHDQRPRQDVALAGPVAAEMDELPVVVRQVRDEAHRGLDAERGVARVPEPDAPGDGRDVAEDRVRQGGDEAALRVGEVDLDGGRLVVRLGVGRRQAGERRLAGEDPVLAVGQLEDGRAVRLHDDESRDAVVAAARCRVFERDRIAEPVREPVERARDEVPVRPAGCQRRAEMEEPERAVAWIPRTRLSRPFGRWSWRSSPRHSIGGHAARPGAVPFERPRPAVLAGLGTVLRQRVRAAARGPEAAMGGVHVDDRLRAGDEVDVVGRVREVPVAVVGRRRPASAGRTSAGGCVPRRRPSSRRRTSARPPFSCGRTYGTARSVTDDDQRPSRAPRFRSG